MKLDRHLLESPGLFAAGASLGETLDVQVIAEGVETGEQARQVHELGCMLAQGFLFGRPQPATEISALLEPGPAQRS